jgi:hypothetical protein
MNRRLFMIALRFRHFNEAPLCGVPHGQDVNRVATDCKQHRVHAVPLSKEQHGTCSP